MEETDFSDEYLVLKSIIDGEYLNDEEVGDNMVVKYFNQNNPGKSFIKLSFELEDFLELIDDLTDDDRDYVDRYFGRYYYHETPEFMSWDTAEDDWNEGYILSSLDVENKQILREIIKYSVNVRNIDDDSGIIAYLGNEEFRREINDIIDEYNNYYNQCMSDSLKNAIHKELENILSPYNIIEKEFLTEYVTIASNLVKLYDDTESQDLNIKELITKLIDNLSINVGNYSEDVWNIGCQYFDNEGFNKDIKTYLEKILEKIESGFEDEDGTADIEGYNRVLKYIKNLEHIKTDSGMNWYKLPTMDGYSFIVDNINVGGVNITLHKDSDSSFEEKRSIKLDDFPSFVENYKLFENKKIKRIIKEQLDSTVNNQVLNFVGTLPSIKDQKPIDFLKKEINNYNHKSGTNLDLKSVLKVGLTKNPKFKIDLFGVGINDVQKVIKTLSYDYNPKMTFTLTINPVWQRTLPGVNIKIQK